MILSLRHPVPVRVILPGGRTERIAYLAAETPVPLVVRAPGTFLPVHVGELGLDRISLGPHEEDVHPNLWAAEGRLWLRSDGAARRTEGVQNRLSRGPAHLARLAAATRPSGWSSLERHLHRTPLRGWHGEMRADAGGDRPGIRLGADGPVPGRVVEDLTGLAAGALARMFERDVRVCGDELFVAFEGLHRVVRQSHDTHPSTAFTHGFLSLAPRRLACAYGDPPFCVRADRPAAWSGFVDRLSPRGMAKPSPGERALIEMSAGLPGDADVSLHANELPGRVLHLVERSGGTRGKGKVDLGPLLRWAALGSVGAIPSAEEADALRDVLLATCEALRHAGRGPTRRALSDVQAYVAEVALPVIDASRPADAADEAALSEAFA